MSMNPPKKETRIEKAGHALRGRAELIIFVVALILGYVLGKF